MPDRMSLCRGRDPEAEVARFLLDRPGTGYGAYSEDHNAIFIPTLRLQPDVVRAMVSGQSLYELLSGCALLQYAAGRARFHRDVWTWCWGDLQLFETGEPIMTRVVLLRGAYRTPDLAKVYRYVKQAPKAS